LLLICLDNGLPLALIAAVNESVWEHLKLGFWPALFYALIEYKYLRKPTNNFLFAKVTCLYLIPISITALFYLYTTFVEDMLVADIAIFILAVVIGQVTGYCLLSRRKLPECLRALTIVALAISVLVFALFTFFPIHLPIFRDPISGAYGIPKT
jgi:hypothetical protein